MLARTIFLHLRLALVLASLTLVASIVVPGCNGTGPNPSPTPSAEPECTVDTDCGSNAFCEAGACVSAADATELHVTLGYMEFNTFVPVAPGADMHLYVGFQGASHILTALLLTGPQPPGDVRLAWSITNAADGAVLSMTEARLTVFPTTTPDVYRVGNQLMQFASRATALDGRDVMIAITLFDAESGEELVTYSQPLHLNIRES